MLCSYCRFAEPFADVPAVFVVDGQSVCVDHVDTAATGVSFGRGLARLHLEAVELRPAGRCLLPVPRCADAGQHNPVCLCAGVAGHSGRCHS